MPGISLTHSLRAEYRQLFNTLEIKAGRFDDVDALIARLLDHRGDYESVGGQVGAPWHFVAAIHNMESGQRFDRHLHNGDPLSDRTRHVPQGRPVSGDPPFTWEESAVDALNLRRIDRVDNWSLERTLYELEGYNGWGYRKFHAHVKSPYLWSFSNHYTRGKYIADGTWSETAVSRQCGAAVLLRRMEQRGDIPLLSGESLPPQPPLHYATGIIDGGEDLQRFLNGFPGVSLRVDGWPGEKTSNAVEALFGFRLHGDPRAD